MWNTINRAWNTLAMPIRLWWTTVTTATDLFVTLKTMWKEWCEIAADTAKRVKDVLLGAWNHGKWYHKAMNIPLSPIIAGWTALEWAVRTTIQPIVNGVVNTWNTGVNTVKNARKSTFGRVFSKKPISDFSYNHLNTRWLKLNNWFEKLQFKKWKSIWPKKIKKISKEEKSEKENSKESEKKNDEKKEERTIDKEKSEKEETKKNIKMKEEDTKKWDNDLKKKEEEIIELKKNIEELEKSNKKEKTNNTKEWEETKAIKLDTKNEKNEKI